MKTLYLVRHAQSQPSAELANSEWPLSARGHAQARELAGVLATLGIEEVHSSPYIRCRQTIAPFVGAHDLPVFVHHDLRERRVAPRLIDDFATVWRRSWDDFSFSLPGCESSTATQQRVVAAVTDICAHSAAAVVAINSHGNALSLLINAVDAAFGIERASAIRNPDVFRMIYRDGRLRWDAAWGAGGLDAFASHHDDTPFPRDRERRRVIVHIAERDAWARDRAGDVYTAPSLATEGFIHCSTIDQLVDTANRWFHGRRDLVVLCIDEARAGAEVVHEAPRGDHDRASDVPARFPHLYGPLAVEAVICVAELTPADDGSFTLPAAVAALR